MADIDVVPKHRSGLSWVWIVLMVVILLMVVWWFMGSRGTATQRTGSLVQPALMSPLGASPSEFL